MSQPEPMRRVNLNVPPELWEEFKNVAHANYRSRSDHLRFLMAAAVRDHAEQTRGLQVGAAHTRNEGGE